MTSTQRWTLTVVCAATAMLMLDIAVVNTALSAIAADLVSAQSYVDGLHDALWVGAVVALAAAIATALLIRWRRADEAGVVVEVALQAG